MPRAAHSVTFLIVRQTTYIQRQLTVYIITPVKGSKPYSRKTNTGTTISSRSLYTADELRFASTDRFSWSPVQYALLCLAFLLNTEVGRAAFQPMLLTPGSYLLEEGTNAIAVTAQCLNKALETPADGHVFSAFSDGVKIAR